MMHEAAGPIVFVHGLIGTLQVPDLLRHFPAGSALAPDLLGYGALSDIPPGEISIRAQVAHLHRTIERHFGAEPVHVVGHSVGGVIAMLLAYAHRERIKCVTSVEGNFTLNDAFWTSSVAKMRQPEVDRMLAGFRDDPRAWLADSGVVADADLTRIASHWLAYQPATTVRAMAQSVISETGSPGYLPTVRSVFARHPVHLIAGARSSGDWDVQDWARQQAASFTVIPGTGHLMMLEQPVEFAAAVGSLSREA